MDEKRKYHFGKNEIKINAIVLILEKSDPISESEILAKFKEKEKFKEINQSTINRHLNNLLESGCIEKSSYIKKGKSNYWDITRLKHLKNIRREFPDIRINTHEKSIRIIFYERGYGLKLMENLGFFYRLFFSVSLFNAFLDSNVNELLAISKNIFLEDKGYIIKEKIKKCKEPFYELYLKANPGFKPEEDFPTDYKDISEEAFLKIYEEKFPGITDEMLPMIKNIFTTYKSINIDIKYESVKSLLGHFINHDIFKGLESPDEYVYFENEKECIRKADEIWRQEGYPEIKRWLELLHLEELKLYSEIIKKYKQPSMFYLPENPDAIYDELKEAYKDQI